MSYTAPTAETLKARYPAFASIADATVNYWLAEAAEDIGETWLESIRARAQMAYAAHKMAEGGLTGGTSQGVASFKSGTFSADMTDEAANRTGYSATVYGREYLAFLASSFSGPRVY